MEPDTDVTFKFELNQTGDFSKNTEKIVRNYDVYYMFIHALSTSWVWFGYAIFIIILY